MKFVDVEKGLDTFKMLVEADLLKGLDALRTGFWVMSKYFKEATGERPTFAVTLCKNCLPSEELDIILSDFTMKFATKLIYPELKAILFMFEKNDSSKLKELIKLLMQTPELKVIKLLKNLVKCGRIESSERLQILQIKGDHNFEMEKGKLLFYTLLRVVKMETESLELLRAAN